MINGTCLKNAFVSAANNILKNKNHINDLNIFPVPDGDTGTNMSATINAAVTEINKLSAEPQLGEVVKSFVSALLRAARGNSGVILSILFRGFSKLFPEKEFITAADIVEALGMGVTYSYEAVTKPTEGTMLTVARVAFEKGKEALKSSDDIAVVWAAVCDGANEALKKTPDLLPVLKKAGVVDAGGKGVCLIFEGMLSVIKDNVILSAERDALDIEKDDEFKSAAAEFDGNINFTYCTEFIVKRSKLCKLNLIKLKIWLQKIGDCVVVVSDDEIIKVHLHTESPGKALETGIKFGQLLSVKVDNLREQHRLLAEAKKAKLIKEDSKVFEPKDPEEEVGFVAVAAGNGVISMFKDLGCANVIGGGQTMNPSTDKIKEAILATPAKTVYLLPNNKNIIMSAHQAVSLIEDRAVIVIPTKTVAQGISALFAYNSDADSLENIELMAKAAANVKTGQVTFAARDSEFGGFKIRERDILALEDGKLLFAEKDPVKAVTKLVKSMVKKETEFITLIYGESISLEQAEKAKSDIESSVKQELEITLINGEQPVYHFIVSAE